MARRPTAARVAPSSAGVVHVGVSRSRAPPSPARGARRRSSLDAEPVRVVIRGTSLGCGTSSSDLDGERRAAKLNEVRGRGAVVTGGERGTATTTTSARQSGAERMSRRGLDADDVAAASRRARRVLLCLMLEGAGRDQRSQRARIAVRGVRAETAGAHGRRVAPRRARPIYLSASAWCRRADPSTAG